tara:strand:+ start:680 stop:1159 length:480 start_codon:yes stop_codon:yes gene_type:complete
MICGDHVCINKLEAKQYFEENLSIEVKILNQNKNEEEDLVQLNLNSRFENKRKISIKKKEDTEKSIKTLSKKEIKDIKNKIAKKNRINKTKKNKLSIKSENKLDDINKKKSVEVNKNIYGVVDVCTIIEKCSIEEISKYLIDQGKERDYPDITIKEQKL